MSKKDDVKAELTKLGIEFDPAASTAELAALLPAGDSVAAEADDTETDDIVVKDPMDLRPVALPLVITLPESASPAQIAYAKILNAYAYQNPPKWALKKEALIAKLKDLKTAPDPVAGNLMVGGGNVLGA